VNFCLILLEISWISVVVLTYYTIIIVTQDWHKYLQTGDMSA